MLFQVRNLYFHFTLPSDWGRKRRRGSRIRCCVNVKEETRKHEFSCDINGVRYDKPQSCDFLLPKDGLI